MSNNELALDIDQNINGQASVRSGDMGTGGVEQPLVYEVRQAVEPVG